MGPALLALLLSLPAAAESPGGGLLVLVKRRFVAADLRSPVDLAPWEASAAAWTSPDPAWETAKASAEGLSALRLGVTSADPAALAEGVRLLAVAVDVPPGPAEALAARYESLRRSLAGAGASIEPETERLRGADGAPLDDADWKRHLESVPLDLRARLFTFFGPAAGIAAQPPRDPLAVVAKPPAPKPAPKARAVSRPAPAPKAPRPKPAAPIVKGPDPKSAAVAKAVKELRAALDAPSLAERIKEEDKRLVLAAWEKAVGGTTDEAGKTDHAAAVNGLRELLAGEGAAGRWASAAAASYNYGSDLGPKAALAGAVAATGTKLLWSRALAMAGAAPKPKEEVPIGAELGRATALEAAAAGWAASLPNAKKSDPLQGTVKTFKLEGRIRSLRGALGL